MSYQWFWITARVGKVRCWPWSRRIVRLSIEPEKPGEAHFIVDLEYADRYQASARVGFPAPQEKGEE